MKNLADHLETGRSCRVQNRRRDACPNPCRKRDQKSLQETHETHELAPRQRNGRDTLTDIWATAKRWPSIRTHGDCTIGEHRTLFQPQFPRWFIAWSHQMKQPRLCVALR